MSRFLYRLGYPVTKMRLLWSIIASIFFSFLLYSASANLGWFTPARAFYLLLGVVEGILVGYLEAKIVVSELMNKAEAIAWQTLPINVVLFGLPLFLAIILFGVSEAWPFLAYFVLPFVPAFLATSGWCYSKFEKERKVQIFMFFYGFKYWIEPIFDVSTEFAQFMGAVISKDVSAILDQARHPESLITILEEKREIEPSTKNFLSKILETLKEYKRQTLTYAIIFVISCLTLLIYFLVLASTNTFGLVQVVDNRIVAGQEFALILGCVPTFSVFGCVVAAGLRLKRKYQKKISTLLTSLNSNILSNLKNLL